MFTDNFLNCIPQTIKTMTSLRTLDVSGSNQVFYLPKNLCHVQTLEVLLLSKPHCMEYPPASKNMLKLFFLMLAITHQCLSTQILFKILYTNEIFLIT